MTTPRYTADVVVVFLAAGVPYGTERIPGVRGDTAAELLEAASREALESRYAALDREFTLQATIVACTPPLACPI